MTPQEIQDYKTKWLMEDGKPVKIHSDLDVEGKFWCRRNLERQQWSFHSYTDMYQHTFYFEHDHHKQQFMQEFNDWVQD